MTARTRLASLAMCAALVALAACSDAADPDPAPTTTTSGPATPSESASPSASASASAPGVAGTPMPAAGAYLQARSQGDAVAPGACEEAYPELLDVSCDDIRLDAGGVLWVAGTRDAGGGQRQWLLRIHAFDAAAGGYLLRYEALDPEGDFRGFDVLRASLTGHGWDTVVAAVRHDGTDARRGYDLLTWQSGGALTLRAHRRDVPNLRLQVSDNRLDEYEADSPAGPFVHRVVRWDGVTFRLATAGNVPASQVPSS